MKIPILMLAAAIPVSSAWAGGAKDALDRSAQGAAPADAPAAGAGRADLKPLGDEMAGVMQLLGHYSGNPMSCYGVDELHLQEAVTKARELASSCLIDGGKGLNPALGKLILDNGKKSASFHCRYTLENAQAVTSGRNKPNIDVRLDQNSRPDQETSVKEMRYLDLTVFHELLHSVDPDGKLMYSLYAHNEGGPFPDPVYACEFACAGNWNGYDSILGRLFVFENLVAPVPEKPDYQCPEGAGAGCSTLKKFAWLCSHGKVDLDSEAKQAQNVLEDAICLRKNGAELIDHRKDFELGQLTYDAALDALKYGEKNHLDKTDPALETKFIVNMSKVVVRAMDSNMFDKARFQVFLSKHDCPSLP